MTHHLLGRMTGLPMASIALLAALCLAPNRSVAEAAEPPPGVQPDSLYVVAVSHLDTEWLWTIVETIRDYIPATFRDNMDLLDRHPGFKFGFEGAHRYYMLREYYPDLWQRLKGYVADGRWSPAGSALEGGDVNIVSPESLMRQFLYGNGFFRREFGRTSVDVFLPDCFGFGWALPSVAAHCGLIGFSTQKLTWGSAYGIPFDVGRWRGPDGAEIVAALRPWNYAAGLDGDWTRAQRWTDALDRQEAVSGMRFGYAYFGVGDRGGSVGEDSVANLETNMADTGPVRLKSEPPDQFFKDLTQDQWAALPVYDGELVLATHGTGSYTSQCAMKRWNRQNEQLGDAAERAAVAASWLGGLPYPAEWLANAWFRFLVHQFHDDVTGTSIPEVYSNSWNDERLAQHRFASVLSAAAGSVARALDTTSIGVPLVVYNALAIDREDVVEAFVRFPEAPPAHVRVFGPGGAEVPSQVIGERDGAARIAFLANVPATGFAVYDVRPSDVPCSLATGLSATQAGLENGRYRVTIDSNGDVSSVFDKAAGVETLAGPVRFAMFSDMSLSYPAWEITWYDLAEGAREYVSAAPTITVVEAGPARTSVEIRREYASDQGTSTYVQRLRLGAGGSGDRVEWDTEIDWHTRMSLLKVEFPLKHTAPKATFDLGLGAITRPNSTPDLYEVPSQQWADLTAPDLSYGVSILSLDKVGWHKPDDEKLYLTLLHTPMLPEHHHDTNDIGHHHTGWAIFGHTGDWTNGTVPQAARFNQPLVAFQAPSHAGTLGRSWGLARVSDPAVAIRALKQAEDSDEVVVRIQETSGTARNNVRIEIATGIAEAREVRGDEQPKGEAVIVDGSLITNLTAFQPRTFAVRLSAAATRLAPAESSPVALPYDTDVLSFNEARADGAFDVGAGVAWAAEQWSSTLAVGGVDFQLGPSAAGQSNAVSCLGQSIAINPLEGQRLNLLAAAVGDVEATFLVGDKPVALAVQDHAGFIGQWDSRVVDGGFVETPMPALPGFLKQAEPVWYGTHRHLADGDDIYAFSYLFRYVLDVPPNATSLTLPNDPRIKILAITLTDDPGGLTVPASVIFDDFDPLRRPLAGWEPTPAQPEPVPDTAEETEVTMPDQEDENLPDVMRDTSGDDSTAEVADAPGDTTTTEIPGIGKHSSGCQSNTGGHPASLVLSVLAIALLLMTRRLRSCRRTA
jgi:alpha-mannosidase